MSAKVLPWPELSPDELASLYAQIKENKVIDINWTSPGKVEPELLFAKLRSQKDAEKVDENEKNMEGQELEPEFEDANDMAADMNDEFDMFDEFNSDEKCTKDKISELRLKHSTTRDTKKVASMDKILFDIKKKIETEEYIRKHSTDDASSILSETGVSDVKRPDSVGVHPVVDSNSPKPGEDPVSEAANPSPAVTEVRPLEEQPEPEPQAPEEMAPVPVEPQPTPASEHPPVEQANIVAEGSKPVEASTSIEPTPDQQHTDVQTTPAESQ